MILQLALLHLGALHPYERMLAVALAFGPFLALFVVVAIRRRQAIAEEEAETAAAEAEAAAGEPTPRRTPDASQNG